MNIHSIKRNPKPQIPNPKHQIQKLSPKLKTLNTEPVG